MKTVFRTSALAIAAALAFTPGVEAKSEKNKGHKAQHEVERAHGYNAPRQVAGPKPCPPGLAKKGNGCLPPGQAKKLYGSNSTHSHTGERYRIGDRFDDDEPYFTLRRNEYDRYQVPYIDGQYYVRTEDSLLRVDQNTNAVIDIITGFDALLNN